MTLTFDNYSSFVNTVRVTFDKYTCAPSVSPVKITLTKNTDSLSSATFRNVDSIGDLSKELILIRQIAVRMMADWGYTEQNAMNAMLGWKDSISPTLVDILSFFAFPDSSVCLSIDGLQKFTYFPADYDKIVSTYCEYIDKNFIKFLRTPSLFTDLLKTHNTVIKFEEAEDDEWVDEASETESDEEDSEETDYMHPFETIAKLRASIVKMKACAETQNGFEKEVEARIDRGTDSEETVSVGACVICCKHTPNVVNIPCGHVITCIACTKEMKAREDSVWRACSMCRNPVVSMVPCIF